MNQTQKSFEEKFDLTVVVVTYNAADVVAKTLSSILQQRQDKLECLCIDGVSEDDTISKIEAFRSQISSLRVLSEPDESLYDAMNKGIAKAQGRYVLFLNAGDVFVDAEVMSDFQKLLSSVEEDPAMIYGHTTLKFHDGKRTTRKVRSLNYINHGQPTIHQSVFFKTETHRLHPYPFRDFPISADYAVMAAIQCTKAANVLLWDRLVAVFENNPASISNRNLKQRVRDAWKVQHEIVGTSRLQRLKSAIRRILAHAYYNYRIGS